MSQREHAFNTILIYKNQFEMLQLLPAKSYKAYEASQCTRKVMMLGTVAQTPSD